jgi:hypothetical protein
MSPCGVKIDAGMLVRWSGTPRSDAGSIASRAASTGVGIGVGRGVGVGSGTRDGDREGVGDRPADRRSASSWFGFRVGTAVGDGKSEPVEPTEHAAADAATARTRDTRVAWSERERVTTGMVGEKAVRPDS